MIGTSLDIREMDPTHTEKEGSGCKTNRLTTLLCPTKACEGLLCVTNGNAEVERSLSENSKVLTSERSLLCDDSLNVIKLTKDAIQRYEIYYKYDLYRIYKSSI